MFTHTKEASLGWPRRWLISLIIGLFVAAVASLTMAPQAGADTQASLVFAGCTSPIGPQAVAIPATVTDSPDPVVAGDQMTVTYRTDYPDNVHEAFNIERASVTWPMPDAVASIDGVTITDPGTFTVDPPVIDHVAKTVTATFHGGGTGRPPTPTVEVTVTIDPGATGTIHWPVFVEQSSTASGVPFVGTVNSTCTPDDPNQTLNTTTIEGSPPLQTCTQTASADGWTKTIWLVGPGGLNNSNGTSDRMYSTEDGVNRFHSSVKFPGVGGDCLEGGTLPAGATVESAAVQLTKTKNCICVGPRQRLHRINQDWSEANLRPKSGPEAAGTPSAEFNTPSKNGTATITSAQLTADVQAFIDDPADNHGWSLRQRYIFGDTGNNADPAGWATREHSDPAKRPTLVIDYSA